MRQDFGVGGRGVREAAKGHGGRFGGGGDRIPYPALCGQAFRERVSRGDGTVEEARGGGKPAGVETGWAAGQVAPQLKQLGSRRKLGGRREAHIAESRGVGVEAQDFGRGRGALKGQALTQRPGGGRVDDADARRETRGWPQRRTRARSPLPFRAPSPTSEPPPAAESFGFPGLSANWLRFGLA